MHSSVTKSHILIKPSSLPVTTCVSFNLRIHRILLYLPIIFIFDNSSVVGMMRYEPGEPDVTGYIKHAQFKLNGQVFMAMDSSMEHQFNFNEGLSLVVECDTQQEIDYFWNKLTEGGSESQCGWLKDQFGVSWQIVPAILKKLMSDSEKSGRVVQAFMKMKKFDIEILLNA